MWGVHNKKLRFIKEDASGLLSTMGIKTPLSRIPLVGLLLFYRNKMNEIVHKFY